MSFYIRGYICRNLLSQMEEGEAVRKTRLVVRKNAELKYHPLPTIPFAKSAIEVRQRLSWRMRLQSLFLQRFYPVDVRREERDLSTAIIII